MKNSKWILISYDTLSTSLIGGLRLNRLKTYLIQEQNEVKLVSRQNQEYDEVDLEVSSTRESKYRYIKKILNLVCIPDSSIFWALRVYYRLIKEHTTEGSIVLTSSPPHGIHLIGILLKYKYNKLFTWIVDFRDPFILNPGYKRNPIKRMLDAEYEDRVLRSADLVLFNTKFDKIKYLQRYPKIDKKSIIVRNGFSKEASGQISNVKRKLLNRIVYSGGSYHGRVPESLISLFEILNNSVHISCDYYGEYHELLEDAKYIRYNGRINANAVPELLKSYQYGIIYLPPEYKNSGRITQKLYDYIGSRVVPIMINPSIEMMEIRDSLDVGYCINEDEFGEKLQIISELLQTGIVNWPSDEFINKNFAREEQFIHIIRALK